MAGILSGTNLGAPLTQRQGSAKWVGALTEFGHSMTTTMILFLILLSVVLDEGAVEIEALVQTHDTTDVNYIINYHLIGDFDDAGVITGTAQLATFMANDGKNI